MTTSGTHDAQLPAQDAYRKVKTMDLLTPEAQIAASSQACWHQLYLGLIKEFENRPTEDKRKYAISSLYFYEVGYSFGRYKAQEKKVREAMLNG